MKRKKFPVLVCGIAVVLLLWGIAGTATAGAMDLPDIKACEIVKGEEVVALAGGERLLSPATATVFCSYVVELAGGGVESYRLSFDSAEMTKLLLDHMGVEEKGEAVSGVLDEAYLGTEPMGGEVQLRALRRGKLGMNVTGERKEVVLEIARLAVTRLP